MKLYGLIGYPLGHSFSQNFFNEKFASERIDARYVNFEIPNIGYLAKILSEKNELKGFNVTIPYKQQIIPMLNELDSEAKAIGAVNVVKVMQRRGRVWLKGFNTDAPAFKNSIRPLLEKYHERALVLGTGGASKAVTHALNQLGISSQLVSRTERPGVLTYKNLSPEIMTAHTVIVNCTPVGMYPRTDECPSIPYGQLTSRHLLYDLLYNPDSTLFMHKGMAHGAPVKNGIEMLLLQAFESWRIWET
ncbi:MAG: shikimate dehydrogenase [Bacteroidales bacterium]|nr:shikimate dehydrogenase [Bacteroidales bacterium]